MNSKSKWTVGVCGPVKVAWDKILLKFARQNLGIVLSKELFPSLLKELWSHQCIGEANIKAGFAKCVLVPYNPEPLIAKCSTSLERVATVRDTDTTDTSTQGATASTAVNTASSSAEATEAHFATQELQEDAPSASSSSASPASSRPSTPGSMISSDSNNSIKSSFIETITPLLSAKSKSAPTGIRNKAVRRQFAKSLTSEECLKRLEDMEAEKTKNVKGKKGVKGASLGPKVTGKKKGVRKKSVFRFEESDSDDDVMSMDENVENTEFIICNVDLNDRKKTK